MEGYYPLKLKRKDLEDFNDDFSDFSLASPARKIRRLDAELPPIIEDESEVPIAIEHSLLQQQIPVSITDSTGGIRIEELPSVPINEEKAIVLFNPNTLPRSPSDFSVSVNLNLISAFKNQLLGSNESNTWRLANDKASEDNSSDLSNGCLAVVPWVPSQYSSESGPELPCQNDNFEMMDAQEVEEENMEVEDFGENTEQINVNEGAGMFLPEGLHQWQQQQHCLVPQLPHNTKAPIVWYR